MAGTGSPEEAHQVLDCIGLYCPMPILKTREEIDRLAIGEVLEVLADDPAAEEDLKAWSRRTGQKMLRIEKIENGIRFIIRKEK